VLTGCDIFDITNPGPISDEDLGTQSAGATVLVGLVSDVEVAADQTAFYAGVGSTDLEADATRPWTNNPSEGRMIPQDGDNVWDPVQQARWTSENGVERLRETQPSPDSNPMVAAAHLWAGYANRIAGDNLCIAVIDGGEPQPAQVYYERAVSQFEQAISVAGAAGADSIVVAARAGLAQSHLILGDYDQAMSYAQQVPDDFSWVAHRSANSGREYNLTYLETHEQRQVTVTTTYSDSLGEGADPRIPFEVTDKLGASGEHEYLRQLKYDSRGSDIPLAKGPEMRLIEAEVRLRDGDVEGAMEKINYVRTNAGVEPKQADSAEEAWLALDRERHLVLWVEGRRLKDNARFGSEGLSPWSESFIQGRDTCFPPSRQEINSNENIESWP
jgi:tetratricopeptide (TPR) repeat protein